MSGITTRSEAPAAEPGTDQPGLKAVRNAVHRRIWRRLPRIEALRRDAISGLSSAISNVPDGMANGALLGVSPVHGLYGAMVGPAAGGALSSTQLMMVTTMAAASLSAAQALGDLQGQARLDGLFAMVILIGVFQLAAGAFNLGRLLRFVSYSVTTGFLLGVSVLLILNPLPDVTGRDAPGGVAGAVELLANLPTIHPPSLALAGTTLLLALVLPLTPVRGAPPAAGAALGGRHGAGCVRPPVLRRRAHPEHLLPQAGAAQGPVVILRLRGLTSIGATLLDVLSGYADEIGARGGRLYLVGVNAVVRDQIDRTQKLDLNGPVRILEATATRGESTRRAVAASHAWLVETAAGKTAPQG